METSVNGAGALSFYWSVSSESGWDYLRISVDGLDQGGPISGSVAWTARTVNVVGAGSHLIRWTYSKDSSASVGADAGYVDLVTFTPFTATPTFSIRPTFSISPTFSPTRTITATFSVSPTRTVTATGTATRSITPTFSISQTPSVSPTFSVSPTPSRTQTPIASAYTAPYADDYEAGSPGWTPTGLWHAVDTTSGMPYALASSGTHSWWYGQDGTGNYDTGVANTGTLTSPAILLSSAAVLSFDSWYQTESTGTSWDTRTLQISVNGGAFFSLQQYSADTMSVWGSKTYNLAAYTGSVVQLRFVFNTVDSGANGYRGWYVDKIDISTPPTPTVTPTRTASPTTTATRSVTTTFSVSPSFSPSS
jgi:hypothetical protein